VTRAFSRLSGLYFDPSAPPSPPFLHGEVSLAFDKTLSLWWCALNPVSIMDFGSLDYLGVSNYAMFGIVADFPPLQASGDFTWCPNKPPNPSLLFFHPPAD